MCNLFGICLHCGEIFDASDRLGEKTFYLSPGILDTSLGCFYNEHNIYTYLISVLPCCAVLVL